MCMLHKSWANRCNLIRKCLSSVSMCSQFILISFAILPQSELTWNVKPVVVSNQPQFGFIGCVAAFVSARAMLGNENQNVNSDPTVKSSRVCRMKLHRRRFRRCRSKTWLMCAVLFFLELFNPILYFIRVGKLSQWIPHSKRWSFTFTLAEKNVV